jgi:hypothetical protein
MIVDLKFHGQTYNFFLDINRSGPRNKFNGQSIILEEQGTTSWSMMQTTPKSTQHTIGRPIG